MSKTEIALSTKAKAMFSKRLTLDDYKNLSAMKSIGDIASYLKKNTYFSTILEGINEKGIHRGQLESLIRYDLFKRFSSLIRYGGSNGYQRIVVMNLEIDQLLACIRSFASDDRFAFMEKIPPFLDATTSFSMVGLLKVTEFRQLVDYLDHTIYHDVLLPFAAQKEFDYTQVEAALNKLYIDSINKLLDEQHRNSCTTEVRKLLNLNVELKNITKIYRLKKYFKASNELIHSLIVPVRYKLSTHQVEELISTVKPDEMMDYLQSISYSSKVNKTDFVSIEQYTNFVYYYHHHHSLLFDNHPDVVLLSYMALSEIEIGNIVDIIEGVRYRISPEKILKLLIV